MDSIIQWNINGLHKHNTDIHRAKALIQPIAFCFQETNLRPNTIFPIKGYNGFYKNRQTFLRASGGVAIFVNNIIECTEIHVQSPLEVVAVSIRLKTPLCICNIYLPDSTDLSLNDLNDIIKQLPKPFLFLGDFNCRNQSWGSNHTDSRGKTFEKFLENDQITLLNSGEYTRHNAAHNSFSAIDLTISNSTFAPKTEWKVLTEYSTSDHWPIAIKILNELPKIHPLPRWRLKNPNWNLYSDIITQNLYDKPFNLESATNQTQINLIIDHFCNIILEAANKTIGKTNTQLKRKSVPWWNKDCNDAIKTYKKALNRFKKTKLANDHINLKKARAQARFITKKSKTESWQKYTSSINPNTSPTEMWNKIKSIKGINHQPLPPNLHFNDDTLSLPSDIAEAFAQQFKKNSDCSNYDPEFIKFKNTVEDNLKKELEINFHEEDNHLNMPFSRNELYTALSGCKSKSPGPDGIPFSFIQNLPAIGHDILLQIINIIWNKGIYPDQWHNAIIIPIPKPNKNKFDIINYRPISLINTIAKTMEKMVNKRLIWHLETSNLIIKEQCGFRKNHTTIDILATLHTDICNAKNNKHHLILISLDLEKAYDMVWRNRVLEIIQNNGINGKMFLFLQNFLKNRKIQVRALSELSKIHQTENGLPQGSVISVTMFLLAINDIFKNIPKHTKHLLFADDCHIYCSGQNTETTVDILQDALNRLQDWSHKTGFKFSAGKSQCITFHTNPRASIQFHLKNSPIPICENLRVLGMIFDNKMRWNSHIKKLKSTCKIRMNIIKTLSHHTWGAKTKSLITIYKSLILSQIQYGAQIYITAKENLLKTLDPIHNEGIRLSIGAFRTSPIDSILCYAGELPLNLLREKELLNYGIKRKSTPNHIGHNNFFNDKTTNLIFSIKNPVLSIQDIFFQLINKLTIHTSVKNKITYPNHPTWLWKIKVNTELLQLNKHDTNPNIITSQFYEVIQDKFSHFEKIYTDASKSTQGVGFSTIQINITLLHKLPPETSIFSAETQAIYEAIILANTINSNHILILSDSLSALLALQNPLHPNEITQNIQLIFKSTTKNIEFMWVPSHIGITGNEMADKAADLATKIIHHPTIFDLPTNDIKSSIKRKIYARWQNHWDAIPPINKLKSVKKDTKKWNPPYYLNRRQEVAITRCRIGHSFTIHSFLINKNPPPTCDECHADLSIQHIILDCSKYRDARNNLAIPPNMDEALNENNIIKIISFLTQIQLINKL